MKQNTAGKIIMLCWSKLLPEILGHLLRSRSGQHRFVAQYGSHVWDLLEFVLWPFDVPVVLQKLRHTLVIDLEGLVGIGLLLCLLP